jgi:hypothetical protein
MEKISHYLRKGFLPGIKYLNFKKSTFASFRTILLDNVMNRALATVLDDHILTLLFDVVKIYPFHFRFFFCSHGRGE